MPTIAIIVAAILLYRADPSLFAWNKTGLATFLVFTGIVVYFTFRKRS